MSKTSLRDDFAKIIANSCYNEIYNLYARMAYDEHHNPNRYDKLAEKTAAEIYRRADEMLKQSNE